MESQREMAHLKSSLELAAFERQTRFSRLHEKRAEIIGSLYGKIVDFHKDVSYFVRLFQSVDETEKKKKLKFLRNTFDSFVDFFENHAIYFDRDSCEKIVSLKEKLDSACSALAFLVEEREDIESNYSHIYAEWDKAMSIMEQEIPVIKNTLEESFCELLGVLQQINKSHT